MTRHRRHLTALALCALAATAGSGCASATDFTSAKMDHDIARTYANYLRLQQTTEGHAAPAAPMVSARCGRGGRLAGSTGAGKDWQCVITNQANGRITHTRYDVVARPTACYTATSPDFGAQFIRTATGKQTANPLYQFDGCLPG